MTLKELSAKLEKFVLESEENAIRADVALRPELAGIRFFDAPLMGCTCAADPIFAEMKANPVAYGEALRLPQDWLQGAKSVVSFFLPYAEEIKVCDRPDTPYPADEWLHARIEGQEFLLKVCRELASALEKAGYKAVIPATSPEFAVSRDDTRTAAGGPLFASNWSERHAAYAVGLGTFGLSKNLITEKGVCGRFGSIITDAELETTPRKYTSPYEYCTFCGECARCCPVRAIGEREKDNALCSGFINRTKELFPPRYGCGKCQVSMPCEKGIPQK